MASTDTCTFYSDYTSDAVFCSSLGHESHPVPDLSGTSVPNEIGYTRYFRVTTYSDSEFGIITDGVTEFDRCLPGPNSCGMQYSNGPCPTGYDALSRKLFGGTTTDYCCLKVPLLDASYLSISLPVEGGTLPIPSVDACLYAWRNTPDSIFPTTKVDVSVHKSVFINMMTMKAIQAVYTATTSLSPGSVSSMPISTSSLISAPRAGLSVASRAGIGVGASIGSILLVAGIVMLIMRTFRNRRQRKMLASRPELHGGPLEDSAQIKELHDYSVRGELPTKMAHELPDTSRPIEIGEGQPRVS